MYQLITDAANLMRLKFRPAAEYAYSPTDMAAALIAVAAVNTALLSPLLNRQYGLMALMFCLNLVKWPVFGSVMSRLLGSFTRSRQPMWGYVLVSELLAVPSLLALYLPLLVLPLNIWLSWGFAATVIGFARISGARIWQVLLGYLVSFCALFVVSMLLLVLFVQAGWVSTEQMEQNFQRWQEQITAPQQN